jgi:GTPase SAR1 family protein
VNNLDWLEDELSDFDDDYLLIDCPGQIELYTHNPVMRDLVQAMTRLGYRVCAVYLLDAQFMDDPPKFFSGVLTAMSAMVQLEVPHINILSKMDLVERDGESGRSRRVERFLETDPALLLDDLTLSTTPKFAQLNAALLRLIDEFNLVSFIPLNIQDEESVSVTLQHIDHALQYGEDLEPKEVRDEAGETEG